MKQFEISNSVRKELSNYLNTHNLNLKAAMDNETTNGEVAAIVHAGLPAMIRKIYLWKNENLFLDEKRPDGRVRRHASSGIGQEKTGKSETLI